MLVVTIQSAKSISRQHLLRLHPRQHKGRLDLDRRPRTHAVARVGGGTTSHWLGQWSSGNDWLSLRYFMESLRGSKHRQWHDRGKSFLMQSQQDAPYHVARPACPNTTSYSTIAEPKTETLTPSPMNSTACCPTRSSRALSPVI